MAYLNMAIINYVIFLLFMNFHVKFISNNKLDYIYLINITIDSLIDDIYIN